MQATLYQNCHIIRGPKDFPIIEDGAILVKEGRIAYVGDADNAPSVYDTVIDLKGHYVMPGLINAHGHYFNSCRPVNNFSEPMVRFSIGFLKTFIGKLYLKREYRENYRFSVNAGITTVRDVGSLYFNDVKCREYYKKKGKKTPSWRQIGPRIIASGRMITATGGHGYNYPDNAVADEPWHDRKRVRENLMQMVDWIKVCNTEGISDAAFIGEAGKVSMTVEEIKAITDEAHGRNKLVATHCESTEGIKRALLAGVDTIEHGASIPDELIGLFKNNPNSLRGYTSLIPTLSAFFIPDLEHKLKPTEENHIIIENTKLIGAGAKSGFLTAVEHDILVGIGNDASVPRVTHYDLYKELKYMKAFANLSNEKLIEMATRDTAKILNIDHITGTLETDKSADFMVLKANPYEDLDHLYKPVHVVSQGHFIKKPKFKVFKGI